MVLRKRRATLCGPCGRRLTRSVEMFRLRVAMMLPSVVIIQKNRSLSAPPPLRNKVALGKGKTTLQNYNFFLDYANPAALLFHAFEDYVGTVFHDCEALVCQIFDSGFGKAADLFLHLFLHLFFKSGKAGVGNGGYLFEGVAECHLDILVVKLHADFG